MMPWHRLQAKIINTVATEFNRMWDTFCKYNPKFTGKVEKDVQFFGAFPTSKIFWRWLVSKETLLLSDGARGDVDLTRRTHR